MIINTQKHNFLMFDFKLRRLTAEAWRLNANINSKLFIVLLIETTMLRRYKFLRHFEISCKRFKSLSILEGELFYCFIWKHGGSRQGCGARVQT